MSSTTSLISATAGVPDDGNANGYSYGRTHLSLTDAFSQHHFALIYLNNIGEARVASVDSSVYEIK